jgi:flagella basal body P-ring formation protein FlgA
MHGDTFALIVVICLSVVAAGPGGVEAAPQGSPSEGVFLQIHLPREVSVQSSLVNLGQISVIRGAQPSVTRASKTGLGRFSVPGQKVVLDRTTILSRLASQGILAEQVRLTGAETVVVRRRQQIVEGDEFIEMAKAFLKQNPPVRSVFESIAVAKPKDLVLPDPAADVQLTPRFIRNRARGYVMVQIVVVADGQEIGLRNIPFRLKYRCRKAVTLQEIAEGAVLTPENVKIEETMSDRPEPVGWKPPYGLVAARALPADIAIRQDMIASAQPSVVIRRNETVVIRVERPGLLVTAVGIALQQAHAGEYVKVRNTDSRRVIVCKVNPDGTVEPML